MYYLLLIVTVIVTAIYVYINRDKIGKKRKVQEDQEVLQPTVSKLVEKQEISSSEKKEGGSVNKSETTTKKKDKPKKIKEEKPATKPNPKEEEKVNKNLEFLVGNLKVPGIEAIDIKLFRLLVATSNKELVLFDLRNFKKDDPNQSKKGYQGLQNNTGTAVALGQKYYYVALDLDKTIAYYEFIGSNNVYFKFVAKFKKNIHKQTISGIFVDENEKFIITVGNGADTFIKVWSLNGEKIYEFNTSQVEHYQVRFSNDLVVLRSWTSEIKLIEIKTQKQNKQFFKLEKKSEFTHLDGVLNGAIDNEGVNGVSINKDHGVQLWKLEPKTTDAKQKKVVDSERIQIGPVIICAIHTIVTQQDKSKTVVAVTDGKNIVIYDYMTFNSLLTLEKCNTQNDPIIDMKFVGKKTVLLYSYPKKSGKISIWNITPAFEKI